MNLVVLAQACSLRITEPDKHGSLEFKLEFLYVGNCDGSRTKLISFKAH